MKTKEKKYTELCDIIAECTGGKENITVYTHCITRLRFSFQDRSKVNEQPLKSCKGVANVLWVGDQLQVVIGGGVNQAFNEVGETLGIQNGGAGTPAAAGGKQKLTPMTVIETLSGCLTPIVSLLIGSGMIQVLLLLLTMCGVMDSEGDTYTVLNFVTNAAFYFLPVYVGAATARKFGMDMWYGMFFGAVLVHPTFTALVDAAEGTFATSLFGIPIYSASYTSSVFPVILTVIFASYVNRFAEKISPALFQSVLVPLITMLVTVPFSLCLLSPIGAFIGVYLTSFIMWLYSVTGFIGVGVMCCLLPLMVTCGMHHATSPYIFESLASRGYDPVVLPANVVNNINIGMVCLAIAAKSKVQDIKTQSASCGFSAFIGGISEPALYGIVLRFRKPMIPVMLGNFVSGCILGLFNCAGYIFTGSYGIFGMVIFINGVASTFIFACVAIAIGAVVSFAASYLLYKDSVEA